VHDDVSTRITSGEVITTRDVKDLISIARTKASRADRESKRRQYKKIQRTREQDPRWVARQAKQQAKEEARQQEESRKRQLRAEEIIDILRRRLGPDLDRFC
jgi:hypothetical protein